MNLNDDIIDVRDIIERVEELEAENEAMTASEEEDEECSVLLTILDELKGYGGDEQWRGYWYR